MAKQPPLSAYKLRKTAFEESMDSTDPTTPDDVEEEANPSIIFFWIAVILLVCGTIAITIGIGMLFGIPWALVCAGTIALSVSLLIGMDS